MQNRSFSAIVIVVFTIIVSLSSALTEAAVIVANKGKYTGRVTVSGKTPNTTVYVWQSDVPAGTSYVDTGNTISTDTKGNGTVSISNLSSGTLLGGHNIKASYTTQDEGTQAPLVVTVITASFASVTLTPGLNGPLVATFAQATIGNGTTLVETWDAGTTIGLLLSPLEAFWVDLGVGVITEGDLQAELVGLTPQVVTALILSDPTITTLDDLFIHGLGIYVLPDVTSVGISFQWMGSSSEYINGQFVETHSWPTLQSYVSQQLVVVVPEPSSVLLFGTSALGMLGFAWRRNRRFEEK